MKVLLVRPKPHQDTIGLQSIMVCEPLELEYLAAVVKEVHEVELVDMILENKPLAYFINQVKPQVVAMTAYITHIPVVKAYARVIKGLNPAIKVVVGGVHAEVIPEDFTDPNIDYIVYANGLSTFKQLLDQLETGVEERIPGLMTKGEEKLKVDNTELPSVTPDRGITSRYRHKYYYMFHRPCALLKTSYGCPYTCNFCFCRQITGGKYFVRDLQEVIDEIKGIAETEIYIVDDNFLVDVQRVEEFCRLLEENGINKRFLIYGRADFIANHEGAIARFAQVGLRAVIVGVESPNSKELEQYNKDSSVELNEQAIAILAKYGVDCYATLILGLDWDEEDFNRLYRWLKGNKLRFINLQPLTPLPGTTLAKEYEDKLIVPRDQYAKWDLANLVIRPGKLTVRKYYFNLLKVYFKTALSLESTIKNLSYGLIPNIQLSIGVWRITWQYIYKIIRG